MFETMGLGGGGAAGGDGGLGALFPLMQSMLENVLSKEVLYSPMKDITDKVSVAVLSSLLHTTISTCGVFFNLFSGFKCARPSLFECWNFSD